MRLLFESRARGIYAVGRGRLFRREAEEISATGPVTAPFFLTPTAIRDMWARAVVSAMRIFIPPRSGGCCYERFRKNICTRPC